MNKKILIIDDDIEICEMLKGVLESEGYIVFIENNGLKGLEAVLELNPDLILLDIVMSQINGFELLETIVGHSNIDSKFFIYSNLSSAEDEAKALKLGADKFLRKSNYNPYQISDIIRNSFKILNNTLGKKILIIDDNNDICEIYKIILKQGGYDVFIENNGLNGLKSALKIIPDLILLDIMMPQLNGFELLESLKGHSDLDSKIFVFTNLSTIKDEDKALKLGADKFLRKSDYLPADILMVVNNFFKVKDRSLDIKIMIIDDNDEICDMYQTAFIISGYTNVVTYTNGIIGLNNIIKYQPDLIILDLMMPNIDGHEILESIKLRSDLNPVIFVNTNLYSAEAEQKSINLGADKFLRKASYTPDQLVKYVDNYKF